MNIGDLEMVHLLDTVECVLCAVTDLGAGSRALNQAKTLCLQEASILIKIDLNSELN